MSRRARHLSLCLAALAAGAVTALAVTAGAQVGGGTPTTASFTAGDNFWRVTGSTATEATISAGGTVTFANAAINDDHDAFFGSSGPTSCDPPLPPGPDAGWTAVCRFNTVGDYSFLCTDHTATMQGTIHVVPASTPTTPTTPTTPGGGSGGGGGTGGDTPGGAPTEPNAPLIKFARRQTGTTLRGSVTAAAGAKIVVTALVSNRSLSTRRPKKVKKVKVGSQTKRSTGTKINFAVKLKAAARRALRSRDKLAVTLRIVVTPSGGKATTKTIVVRVRED